MWHRVIATTQQPSLSSSPSAHISSDLVEMMGNSFPTDKELAEKQQLQEQPTVIEAMDDKDAMNGEM